MTRQIIPEVSPQALESARLLLHHAVQIPAIMARSFLGDHPEDFHANLGWDPKHKALLSHKIPWKQGHLQVGIVLKELKLLVLAGEQSDSLELSGQSWESAIAWLTELLKGKGLDTNKIIFEQPYEKDLPEFSTKNGSLFTIVHPEAFLAFSHFYANTDLILKEILHEVEGEFDIRCWPHHFDIASLIQVDKERSIGVGLSPGDGAYAEPYYYINLWPYPDPKKTNLPALTSGGNWHTQGWVGAVLKASDFVSDKNQQDKVSSFIREAILHSRNLLAQ